MANNTCSITLLLLLTAVLLHSADAFVFTSQHRRFATAVSATLDPTKTSINGSLIKSSDAKEQLLSAFSALSDTDQYDAVLTGLCAKILDDNAQSSIAERLQDPFQLLQEMNDKRLMASPRSLMALIDATVKAQDISLTTKALTLCLRNGNLACYGNLQSELLPFPSLPASRVKCLDGTTKTRQERLDSIVDIPNDTRAKELSNALIASTITALCVVADIGHVDSITPFTNSILTVIVGVGVVDNFYDVVKNGSNFIIQQISKSTSKGTNGENKKPIQLPDKKSLPLGLGTGQLTGTTVRGFTRLLTVDAEREALCEASGLLTAYKLGLPCFAFQPNAIEASKLVMENNNNSDTSYLSSTGILRVLVWLMAPVAAESSKYSFCIMSNPEEPAKFLKQLEDSDDIDRDSLWWLDDPSERDDLLKWAFAEADVLLRQHRKELTDVSNRLEGGAATIADCVAVMENW